ncbi:hypothetical protein A6U96_14035 [Agrobacterium tumefaciens]|nr:hypothetical protein A6U96_14035 [Agrobacterium tumefaciens]
MTQLIKQEEDGELVIVSRSEDYIPEIPQDAIDQFSQMTGKPINEAMVAQLLPPVRDLEVRYVKNNPIFDFKFIGVENVLFSDDATFNQNTGGVKSSIQGYREYVEKQKLKEEGFDPEIVDDLPFDYTNNMLNNLMNAQSGMFNNQKMQNKIEKWTIFTKIKIDDETPRHYKIILAGDILNSPQLLGYEECTKTYPLAVMAPFPMADRIYGQGIGDRTSREQDLISKIQRGVLNNLNYVLDPVKIVNPSNTNVDDLLNLHPGKIVRSEDPDGGIKYNTPAFVANSALPIIDTINQTIDNSIGVGGNLAAIDPSDLADVTATAARQRKSTQETLIEDVTRLMSETGYRYLARIIIDQMAQKPELANKYLSKLLGEETQIIVDESWDLEMDVGVTIDYGMMDRNEKIASLTNILQLQQQGQGTVATPQNVYATLIQLAEASGIQNAQAYFTDPAQIPPPPPPPDPNAGLVQIETLKAQNKATEIQLENEQKSKDQEFELIKLQITTDVERDKMAQDMEKFRIEKELEYKTKIEIERLRIEQERQRTDFEWTKEALAQQQERDEQKAIAKQQQQEADAQAEQIAQQMAQQMQLQEAVPTEQQIPPMGM